MATVPEGRFARLGGKKEVVGLLSRKDRKVAKVFLSERVGPPFSEELARAAAAASVTVETAPPEEVDRVAQRLLHQGVVALYERPEAMELSEVVAESKARSRQLLLVVVDSMAGHPDLDELMRMAILAGAQGIIRRTGTGKPLPDDCAQRLLLCEVSDLASALDELRSRHKLWVLGCSKDASDSVFEMELDWSMAVVLGGPDQNLAPALAERCDVLARFPLAVGDAPVNQAQRYAVLLYDLMRQRLSWAARGKIRDVLWEAEAKRKR